MLKEITATGFKGASQGGLAAGFSRDITTSGFAPKGYRIPGGENPGLRYLGLEEHESDKIGTVVESNLFKADAVLFFCSGIESEMEKKILEMVDILNIPILKVNITKPLDKRIVVNFIVHNKVKILHITGKTDTHSNKTVYSFVRNYVITIIDELRLDYSFRNSIY